jgi:hypothetical protein
VGRSFLRNDTCDLFQILFFQNFSMMQFVAGDHICQRADGDFVLAGDAATGPGCFVEIAKQRDRGAADGNVILDEIFERTARERAIADVIVLLESCEGRLISALRWPRTSFTLHLPGA